MSMAIEVVSCLLYTVIEIHLLLLLLLLLFSVVSFLSSQANIAEVKYR